MRRVHSNVTAFAAAKEAAPADDGADEGIGASDLVDVSLQTPRAPAPRPARLEQPRRRNTLRTVTRRIGALFGTRSSRSLYGSEGDGAGVPSGAIVGMLPPPPPPPRLRRTHSASSLSTAVAALATPGHDAAEKWPLQPVAGPMGTPGHAEASAAQRLSIQPGAMLAPRSYDSIDYPDDWDASPSPSPSPSLSLSPSPSPSPSLSPSLASTCRTVLSIETTLERPSLPRAPSASPLPRLSLPGSRAPSPKTSSSSSSSSSRGGSTSSSPLATPLTSPERANCGHTSVGDVRARAPEVVEAAELVLVCVHEGAAGYVLRVPPTQTVAVAAHAASTMERGTPPSPATLAAAAAAAQRSAVPAPLLAHIGAAAAALVAQARAAHSARGRGVLCARLSPARLERAERKHKSLRLVWGYVEARNVDGDGDAAAAAAGPGAATLVGLLTCYDPGTQAVLLLRLATKRQAAAGVPACEPLLCGTGACPRDGRLNIIG